MARKSRLDAAMNVLLESSYYIYIHTGCIWNMKDSPTAGKQSPGLFSDPPFEPHIAQKYWAPKRVPSIFGARDGTRTHTAKPHAPQTCLSTIPTLSQTSTAL